MNSNKVDAGYRRRSRAEAERLVLEFAQSGLGRRRIALSEAREEIVPVGIVEGCASPQSSMRAGGMTRSGQWLEPRGQFRVVLSDGLGIEVDRGFTAGCRRQNEKALITKATSGSTVRR